MNKYYLLLLLLVVPNVYATIELQALPNYNMSVGNKLEFGFQYKNYNATAPVTFFINGPYSLDVNGYIQNYSNNFSLNNYSWRTVHYNFLMYEPGSYNIMWGIINNNDNTTVNNTFIITVEGNSTERVIIRDRRDRYGYTSSNIVAERLANRTRNQTLVNESISINTTINNITSNETVVIEANLTNTTAVEQVVVPVIPPVQTQTPDNTNTGLPEGDFVGALWVVGGIGLFMVILFVLLFKFVLSDKEDK